MIQFTIEDRRDDSVPFEALKPLECFYIGDCNEPYIKVPEFIGLVKNPGPETLVPNIDAGSTMESGTRQFNALRIRTLQHIYIVPTNSVHKLQSKLTLSTEPLKIKKEIDETTSNTSS